MWLRLKKRSLLLTIIAIFLSIAMLTTVQNCFKRRDSEREGELIYLPKVRQQKGWETIITGKEIKQSLEGWSEEDKVAILVATSKLLSERNYDEISYLKYALDSTSKSKEKAGTSGTRYMLCYVNYGNVLYDTCIIEDGTSEYYTLYGLLKDDVMSNQYDETLDCMVETITQSKVHPWMSESSIDIPEDEIFEKEEVTDQGGKLIGIVYTTLEIKDVEMEER